jgi:hypothetical protein
MIHKEQKKWMLYSNLPKEVNKLFIYMPTENWLKAETALQELSKHLMVSKDAIGKVTRVDLIGEGIYDEIPTERFPLVSYNGGFIKHDQIDIVNKVEEVIETVELSEGTLNMLKVLKDGKDLL